MAYYNEENVVAKFSKTSYISNFIKFLTVTNPNKVLPTVDEFYELEDEFNKSKFEFTHDADDCSTVALTSNPSSFSSTESAEEHFAVNDYSFEPNKFKMISVLGNGSFGTAVLAEYEEKFYAIKKLPKHKINESEIFQIMLEKQILMQMESDFVLHLYGTYQTKNELCFITEALENGDLYSAIYDGNKLVHDECVFYGACIILGIDCIHSKNVVYRDLKPENIMIGSNGYPKIIDFGLAKKLPYEKIENGVLKKYTKCYTLCGTPEYVAPELILGKGYDAAADIWAFGAMLYEMICRTTPFIEPLKNDGDWVTKTFTNIVICGKNGIVISEKLDRKTDGTTNARDLISQLLNGNATERLGKGNKPISLLKHPYFCSTGINIENLYNQTIEAPILQPQYIGKDIETLKKVDEYNGDQDIFKDF